MNQLMLELYQQALEFAYKNISEEYWNTDNFHAIVSGKFAELIVRECSKVIVNGGYRNPALGEKHPLTPPEIAQMIKEHFGVEE